jgi:DNA-binding transcriptional MerR regulator
MSDSARPLMMPEAERIRAVAPVRARPKKAPSAFRTISEVADQLHIPQHVLRFWETKFQQVKPLKRGGGRRYYRPEDIGLLRRISDMLYIQGYTIKGVQRLLREGGGKLSDNIPPPRPDELASHEESAIPADGDSAASGKESVMNMISVAEPELPMPGLTPASSPATSSVRHANARAQKAEAEAERLRALLNEVLAELETLRALVR